jgi:class 3 adenylate cyclase/tetratricopeptide (TPR) repeat protein
MRGATSVRGWLEALGLAQHAEAFEREQIDLEALRHLTSEDLKELGLPMGHRVKLLAAIKDLDAAAAPPEAPAARAPQSYTPPHLAQKILASRAALEGERKQVTVLFCDIANSTALAETLGPEAMHALLQRFFALGLEEVHRYEGTVNQFLGDGFMALFGAPLAHEDDARRAALTALEIRNTLHRRQAAPGLPAGETLQVRLGLNTGLVVVGSIGDNLRMDYTAVGDTTNLAARLQQNAQPGQILASEATARLVRGYVELEDLGQIDVKGKSEPVHGFAITARGTRRSRLEQTRLSPFVGRERELAFLLHAAQEARERRGQVVGIVGEPGVGKSRLVHELRLALRGLSIPLVEGGCQSFARSVPYLALQDVLRGSCSIQESDAPGAVRDKLRTAIAALGLEPDCSAPYLLRLLGLSDTGDALEGMGPETLQARIRDAFLEFVQGCGRSQPLVLFVEDLHWIDRSSEDCLAALVERLPGRQLLLVTTTRPGYNPPWSGKSFVAQLPLSVLSTEASRKIVAATLQRSDFAGAAAEPILQKAEGNPLFLEELALALEAGAGRLGQALPDTIQGVLAARIDRLPPAAKRVLQIGAVLGRQFPLRLLEAVASDEADLPAQLAALTQLELLHERPEAQEVVYAFKHALVQDVAYDTLLGGPRAALHQAAGEALERLYAARIEEHYELLAYHFSRSPAREQALDYLSRANRKAIAANAVADAKEYFEQALRLLHELPDTPTHRHLAVELLVRQIHVCILTNTLDEYERHLQRHAAIADALPDQGLRGHFLSCLGHTQFGLARPRQAIGTLTPAAAICEHAGNYQGAGQAYVHLQWCHLQTGEFDDTLRFEAPALAALDRAWDQRLRLYVYGATAWACSRLGRWALALERSMTCLKECEAHGDQSLTSSATGFVGLVSAHRGDAQEAVRWTRRAFEMSVTPGDRAWAQCYYGWAMVGHDPLQAIELLSPLVPLWLHKWWFDSLALVGLGDAYLRAGQLERAQATLEQAIEISQPRDMLFMVAPAQRLLGEVALASGRLDQSEARFAQALQLVERFGAQHEIALTWAGQGRLRLKQGRRDEARGLLQRALATFERLASVGEPDRVRAELAELA